MNEDYYPDINRAVLSIKLKKPFIDWLAYTSQEHDPKGHELKPEDIEPEGFDSKDVYLIPAFDNNDEYEKFIGKHCGEIFEYILCGWYSEPEMWPRDRSWKIFREWFDYEIQTMVFDMIPEEPIEYE